MEHSQIVVLTGQSGTGKTKLCQHLFQHSSVFQNTNKKLNLNQSNKSPSICSSSSSSIDILNHSNSSHFNTINSHTSNSNTQLKCLSSSLACAHFCSQDDFRSLETAQFIHNLAWSLTKFNPLKNLYKSILTENNNSLFKKLINPYMSKLDSDLILKKCIIDPIEALVNSNTLNLNFYVIIDGFDYAQKVDHSDNCFNNLSVFLTKNAALFPKWFKFIFTVRSDESLQKRGLKYHAINLDAKSSQVQNFSNLLNKDINDYIISKINKSIEIQKNILHFNSSIQSPNMSRFGTLTNKLDSNFQLKFVQHLSHLAEYNYTFIKLTLDLIIKGNLIIKSSNFKVGIFFSSIFLFEFTFQLISLKKKIFYCLRFACNLINLKL